MKKQDEELAYCKAVYKYIDCIKLKLKIKTKRWTYHDRQVITWLCHGIMFISLQFTVGIDFRLQTCTDQECVNLNYHNAGKIQVIGWFSANLPIHYIIMHTNLHIPQFMNRILCCCYFY